MAETPAMAPDKRDRGKMVKPEPELLAVISALSNRWAIRRRLC